MLTCAMSSQQCWRWALHVSGRVCWWNCMGWREIPWSMYTMPLRIMVESSKHKMWNSSMPRKCHWSSKLSVCCWVSGFCFICRWYLCWSLCCLSKRFLLTRRLWDLFSCCVSKKFRSTSALHLQSWFLWSSDLGFHDWSLQRNLFSLSNWVFGQSRIFWMYSCILSFSQYFTPNMSLCSWIWGHGAMAPRW